MSQGCGGSNSTQESQQAAAAQQGDRAALREDPRKGADHCSAQDVSRARQGEGQDRPRQGQKCRRQARYHQKARGRPRLPARHAQP